MSSLTLTAQKVAEIEEPQHAFQLMGGISKDLIGVQDQGYSLGVAYQVYFPKRFILGVEVATDQSSYQKLSTIYSAKDRWDKFTGFSGAVRLGYQIVNRKYIDFSFSAMPQIYHRSHFIKTRDKETKEEETEIENTTFFSLPLLANRFEFNYKISPAHAVGFVFDVHLDFDTNIFGDVIASKAFMIGRAMLSYRFVLPNN
ncbi:hypothetical protein DIT68_14175 [Brumimicrobium oceani]|uniref:Outer membrane protein beta-barrel domain-containing protein n=2 Tax=Brumimicrobium oceani TaxID=2100725 RepID=A0A2U2X391_9FLAO|nr:hypothetical protein DIT68_14175 [Brumimicrobium oceani]